MAGITRIRIGGADSLGWRGEMAKGPLCQVADNIYRRVFADIGMPLAPGCEEIKCSKGEAAARYDWKEGIDVIFETELGARATGQEKFLTFHKSTVTFEERKTSGKPGAWYYCTAQYYFVGYAREWIAWTRRNGKWVKAPTAEWPKKPIFQDWILVDNPAIHRADARGDIHWYYRQNGRDGRRATFRYVYFDEIPLDCIIARHR